ncbi:MAG: YlxM family DNA-binding protein [Clostridia bacterium]|nr:YlxM family DNA-binding protein [Clostridia bacterium]
MSEKNMRYCLLLDFYGEVLGENQREMMDLYYNEDFSLSEIADEIGITRQGVRDAVRRAEDTLSSFEEKLGLIARFERLRQQRDAVRARIAGDGGMTADAKREVLAMLDALEI